MQELTGRTLDRYRIVDHLADDYWGSVYKAFDPKFDRTVAIQILDPQLAKQDHLDDHFTQLARTLLNWRHSGIARVYDFGQENSLSYLVREFVPGGNLRQLLKDLRAQDQWISLVEAVQLVRQVCLALEYAHQRNVLHGDLHSRNIFLAAEAAEGLPYQPVLVNLGLTRAGLPVPEPSTSAYQSPEVKRGARFEARADVYSAGILLYELATGQLPVGTEGKPTTAVRSTALETEAALPFLPPRMLRSEIPEVLNKLIAKALAARPNDRFENASAIAEALSEITPQAAQVKTAPPGLKRAVSLLPAYHNSLNNPIYAEVALPEIIASPQPEQDVPDLSQDQIHILEPDQSVRSVAMKPEGLTFGRASDNDVILDHPSVSRHHARIDFDGENYQVHDLKSMNGTYLETVRLSPDILQVWLPGENLRLGEIWLRLERAGQSLSTMAVIPEETHPSSKVLPETSAMFLRPDGSSIDPSKMEFSSAPGWVGAFLETRNISVSPGESITTTVLFFNRGPAADVFQITIQGIPADWVPNQPQTVNLPANGQKEVKFTFKPPRAWQSRAGRHPVTLRVASHNAPRKLGSGQSVELRLNLTVAAYSQFSAELRPRQIAPGEIGQVVVNNQGNLPETFTLVWEDKRQQMSFDPPKVRVIIPAGKSAAVEFHASLIQPRWFGGEQAHTFTVHVNSQTGQVQPSAGEFISNGLIPAWAPIALAALCIMLSCVLFLVINQVTAPSRYARQTANAEKTIVAFASQETAKANTATQAAIEATNLALTLTSTSYTRTPTPTPTSTITPSPTPSATPTPTPTSTSTFTPTPSSTLPITPSPTTVDLSISIDNGQASSVPGMKITYTIQVINKGPGPVTNATIVDTFPSEIANVTWTCSASSGSKCLAPSGVGNVNVGVDLGVSGTATVIAIGDLLPGAAGVAGLLVNTVRINAPPDFNEPNTVDNLAVDTDTLNPKIALSITKTDDRTSIAPGQNTSYTIVVTNNGPSTAPGINLTDIFPAALTGMSWLCSATPGSSCATSTQQFGNINTSVSLGPGGRATITANGVIRSDASGILNNIASLSSPIDPANNNKSASDTTSIIPQADLVVKVTAPVTTTTNTSLTYTIDITNTGPSAASNVVLTDLLPNGVTFTSSTPGGPTCVHTASKVTCNLGNLPNGGSAQVKIVVNTPTTISLITNQASVLATETDPIPANNQVVTQVQVE